MIPIATSSLLIGKRPDCAVGLDLRASWVRVSGHRDAWSKVPVSSETPRYLTGTSPRGAWLGGSAIRPRHEAAPGFSPRALLSVRSVVTPTALMTAGAGACLAAASPALTTGMAPVLNPVQPASVPASQPD